MIALALVSALLAAPPGPAAQTEPAAAYDPLAVPAGVTAGEPLDLDVRDADRNRTVPVRVRLPAAPAGGAPEPAPVVLFSHGLGGSRAGGTYLATHWSAREYACVNLQHPGSDESVWKDAPRWRMRAALTRAASGENYFLRLGDVRAVLDRLAEWNGDPAHPLHGRLDLTRVGMSGHSFGAQTTQAVSGQTAPGVGARHTDARIDAAVILSPSPPARHAADRAFASVAVPWLLMTGTEDESPIGGTTAAARRDVFPHLPPTVDRYELVLAGADHAAFGDPRPNARGPARDPRYHRAVLALSAAFWDAHLKADPAAAAWLHGPAARAFLEKADDWRAERAVGPRR